jgi:hypothetical protein
MKMSPAEAQLVFALRLGPCADIDIDRANSTYPDVFDNLWGQVKQGSMPLQQPTAEFAIN